jgi:hypothetical protein
VGTIQGNIEYQVPGGPDLVSPGPAVPVTVKPPTVELKATCRKEARGPGNADLTRLSVGDSLEVLWQFGNVTDLRQIGSVVGISGSGMNTTLAPEQGTFTGPTTYRQGFRATGIGPAHLDVGFQFADMTADQALKESVEAHVEMPKQEFLNHTVESTAILVTAIEKATAWMDSLAVAYADAWDNHTKALKDQADFEKLVDDLILGAALAFIPGGIGGVIGKTMSTATATAEDAFICDGIKDLQKWGFRNAAPALLGGGGGGSGLNAYPKDPFQWRALKGVRIHSEIAHASDINKDWIHRANEGKPDFMLEFDPAKVMADALKIEGTDLQSVAPVDMDKQSLLFEKGFWATWLEIYGYKLAESHRTYNGEPFTSYIASENAGKKVKERCEAIGLDISPYMEAARRRVEEEAKEKNAY